MSGDGRVLYFAYGSNLDVEQMTERCPGSRPRVAARLTGHRLDFTHLSRRWGGGAADILPASDGTVWGALYDIDPDHVTILGRFEGGYDPIRVEVAERDGAKRRALTYTVRAKGRYAPTSRYVQKMLRWGAHWGLPEEWLRQVRAIADSIGSRA